MLSVVLEVCACDLTLAIKCEKKVFGKNTLSLKKHDAGAVLLVLVIGAHGDLKPGAASLQPQ